MKKSITNPEVQLISFEEIDIICASEATLNVSDEFEDLDGNPNKAASRSPWGGSPWD